MPRKMISTPAKKYKKVGESKKQRINKKEGRKISTANTVTVGQVQGWWNEKIVGLVAVIGISLLIYGTQVPTVPVGYGDSDLFLVMGSKLGVMNAPGYPIYLLLLNIWTHLGLGVAHGGHLLSAVLAAWTLGIVFLVGWELYSKADTGDRKYTFVSAEIERWILALVPVVALGISGWFWLSALVAERFILTDFLISLLLLLWLWSREANGKYRNFSWWGLGLTLGLGMSHQWVFWTLVPVLGWSLYCKRREVTNQTQVITVLLVMAGLLLPFGLLSSFDANNVSYSQVIGGGVTNLKSFVVSGYVGDGLVDIPAGSVLPKITARLIFNNWWMLTKLTLVNMGAWTILTLIWTGLYHSKKTKQKYWLFGDVFKIIVSYSLGLALILPWGQDRLNLAQVTPYLVALEVMTVVWMWFGWQEFLRRFGQSLKILFSSKVVMGFLLAVIVVPLGVRVWLVGKELKLRSVDLVNRMYTEVMGAVEPNAIITCYSYGSCYDLIYQQQVAGLKPEVTILPFYWQTGKVVVPGQDLTHFNYSSYPFLLFDAITWNLDKRPIYAVDLFDQYYQFFGINLGFINFVPQGYYGKLARSIPDAKNLPTPDYQISDELINQINTPENFWEDRFVIDVARKHTLNAQVYMQMGLRDLAVNELNLASDLIHRYSPGEQQRILDARDQIESTPVSEFFELGTKVRGVDYILSNIQPLLDAKLNARAVELAQGAVAVDPLSVKARLKWAELLNQTGDPQRALQEYYNVLVVDPNNETALEKIASLQAGEKQQSFDENMEKSAF